MDLKEREKEVAESEYASAVNIFEEVATKLYHQLKRKEALEEDARQRLSGQVTILDIQSMQASMLFLQELIQKQQRLTQQAREQMDHKQQLLMTASLEHKKHEKIREKKHMQFTLEENRLNQMQMDELSIQRFVRQ